MNSRKSEIVGWGMPNYGARVEVTINGFTAPFDGLLVVQGFRAGGNQNASVIINGLWLGFNLETSYNNSNRRVAISLPINKGSVVTFGDLTELTYGYFFRFNGV